jgi:hypothetical protein
MNGQAYQTRSAVSQHFQARHPRFESRFQQYVLSVNNHVAQPLNGRYETIDAGQTIADLFDVCQIYWVGLRSQLLYTLPLFFVTALAHQRYDFGALLAESFNDSVS